jgi:parallel beta-helix repeat protein
MSRGRLPSYEIVPATLVVGKAGSSKDINRADIVCPASSVSDQTYINAAINALPAVGGKIALLEGLYIVDGNILPNSNNCIEGCGDSTEIKIKDGINATFAMFSIPSKNNITIKNLKINGNKTNRVGGNQNGVSLSTSNYCLLKNIHVTDINNYSISIANSSTYNKVIKCKFLLTSSITTDILISGTSNNNIITNNIDINGGVIFVQLNNSHNNNITINTVVTNTGYGVDATSSNYNIIEGNYFSNTFNSSIKCITSNNNLIKGNTVVGGNGQNGIYLDTSTHFLIISNIITQSIGHGITLLGSNDNTIISNHIKEVSQSANNTYSGIVINVDSDRNNVQGNTIRRGVLANQAKYGIIVGNANCDNNLVTNNDLLTSGVTASLFDAGTGTITVAGNRL